MHRTHRTGTGTGGLFTQLGLVPRLEAMNLTLMVIVISEICLGICAWRSSACLRWFAAHLLTRADVIDLSKEATVRRMQFWNRELDMDRHWIAGASSTAEFEHTLARSSRG